jgi:nucleoside-diphosphate-sugar epimerase
LLDIAPVGEATIVRADLSQWDKRWVDQFRGVDVTVHLAGDPRPPQTWPHLIASNLDGLIHVFQASLLAGVRRVVYASSSWVMGGYEDTPKPARLTTQLLPRPGSRWVVNGVTRDCTAYGSAKLFGERLGKCYAEAHGLTVLAVRIGSVQPGENRAEDIPPERDGWSRLKWLSNRDYCQLMERCITAEPVPRFVVLNGMSANSGMRWDIDFTRQTVGYEPQDDVTRPGRIVSTP